MSDRALIGEVAEAAAAAAGGFHSVRCETAGCWWAVHAASREKALADYADHLRTSARHTGGEWIDRDGRQRRGLEYTNPDSGEA